MINTVTLQSGFVTTSKLSLTKQRPESKEEVIRDAIHASMKSGIPNPFSYSKDVADLLEEVRGNPNLLTDFDFRARVYRLVKFCFQDISFHEWLRSQSRSNYVSILHKKFLAETVEYLKTGNRNTSISVWRTMLSPRILNDADRKAPMPELSVFPTAAGVDLNTKLGMFQHWLTLPNGVADIMHFLNTVFGKYDNRIRI